MATSFALLGSTTLGSAATSISLTGLATKQYLIIEIYTLETLTLILELQLNGDTGTNYAFKQSHNGAATTATLNNTNIALEPATSVTPSYFCIYVKNVNNQEKLLIINHIDQNTAGAANAPNRDRQGGKWSPTNQQISRVDVIASTSTLAAGTIITVYGSD